jgi:HJR/Mrr/RecB family endonuclease
MLIPPITSMTDEGGLYAATIDAGREVTTPMDSDDSVSIEEIDRMEPTQFEDWALKRLAARGYRPNRTPVTGDAGADGVLIHAITKERIILQCKHRQPGANCDDEPIENLLEARSRYGNANRMVALTNALGYTATARDRAARLGIVLVARNQIARWPKDCF